MNYFSSKLIIKVKHDKTSNFITSQQNKNAFKTKNAMLLLEIKSKNKILNYIIIILLSSLPYTCGLYTMMIYT